MSLVCQMRGLKSRQNASDRGGIKNRLIKCHIIFEQPLIKNHARDKRNITLSMILAELND